MKKFALVFLFIPLIASAQLIGVSFWRNRVSTLKFTTSSQIALAGLCSGVTRVGNYNASNTLANVSSNLTVNLTGPAEIIFYSDPACTVPITQATISSGSSTTPYFYFVSTTTGTKTISADAVSYTAVTQNETISTNNYVWTGGGSDANWNTAANWSGGAVPGIGMTAVFNETCSSNCSPNINVSISIGGIRMASGYFGTITQGASSTIALSGTGWAQLGGTFVGSSANISGMHLAVAGGTYTDTSGTHSFSDSAQLIIGPSATYNHNNGTLIFNFNYGGGNTIIPGTASFNNVTINGDRTNSTLTGTFNIYGTLTLNSTNAGEVNTGLGTLKAYGDVTMTGSSPYWGNLTIAGNASGQTITGNGVGTFPSVTIAAGTNNVTLSGSLRFRNYTVSSVGTLTTTGTNVKFVGDYAGWYSISAGTATYNNVTFEGTRTTWEMNSSTLNVGGDLAFNVLGGDANTISSGTINAYGNNISYTGANYTYGSAIVVIAGNTSGQTVSSASTSGVGNLTIQAGANAVTLSGSLIRVNGTYKVVSAGSLTTTGTTLSFTPVYYAAIYPVFGTFTYNNLEFYSANFYLGGYTINVGGNLSYKGNENLNMTNGNFNVAGNFSSTSTAVYGGATLNFNGSSAQTITIGSGATMTTGSLTVSGSGGVTQASALSINSTSQTLTVQSGSSYSMAGYNLTTKGLALNGTTLTKGGGTLNVNGTTVGTGSLYGGTVAP